MLPPKFVHITSREGGCVMFSEEKENAPLIICLWVTIISQLSSENWQITDLRLKNEGIKPK